MGINSSFTCAAGFTIDPSCLLSGSCPNFAPCNLQAHGLLLTGGTAMAPTNLIVGNSGTFGSVYFGDIVTPLQTITGFANNIFWRGSTVTLQGYAGPPFSNPFVTVNSNNVDIYSPTIIRLYTQGAFSTGIQLEADTGGVRIYNNFDLVQPIAMVSISAINIQSNHIMLAKYGNGTFWMVTNPDYSYFYNFPAGSQDPTRDSCYFTNDITLEGGNSIVSTGNYLQLGPSIDIGLGNVHTTANILSLGQVGGGFANLTQISASAILMNNEILPNGLGILGNGYLYLSDLQGVRITGGPVLVDTPMIQLGTGTFNVTDMIDCEAPIVNLNPILPIATGNLSAGHVLIQDDVRITGNLQVDGQIFGGSCAGCVSDERVKENITKLSYKESIKNIQSLTPVSYKFKKDYQKQNSWVGSHTHHGFIAQEVIEKFPYAIRKYKRHNLDDFHELHKDMLIADLVNSVQYLLKEVKKMRKIIKRNRF